MPAAIATAASGQWGPLNQERGRVGRLRTVQTSCTLKEALTAGRLYLLDICCSGFCSHKDITGQCGDCPGTVQFGNLLRGTAFAVKPQILLCLGQPCAALETRLKIFRCSFQN